MQRWIHGCFPFPHFRPASVSSVCSVGTFTGCIRVTSCSFVVPPTRCSLPPSGSSQLAVFLPICTRELINQTVILTESPPLEETETKAFVEAVRADI